MSPTIELLCGHRSIRHFTDEPVTDAQREAIIAAARSTSSSSFLQCSSIIRITDRALREALVPLTGGQKHVGRPLSSGYFAPILIVICRSVLTRSWGLPNNCCSVSSIRR